MGILSGLGSNCSFFLPQIQTLRSRTHPPTMCLKQPQHNNNHNKLKLLVTHRHNKSLNFTTLSTEEEDDNRIITTFSDPFWRWPVAGINEVLLDRKHFSDAPLRIWNLSTKEVMTFPHPPRPHHQLPTRERVYFYGLGLDPKTSSSDSDSYKVLTYLFYQYQDPILGLRIDLLAELYSLKNDSWNQIDYPHINKNVLREKESTPIYMNGFNYWIGYPGIGNQDFVIFSFDYANECFPSALIPGPCAYYKVNTNAKAYQFVLAGFEGSLAVVVHLAMDNMFELWVWSFDDESWSRRGEWTIAGVRRPLGLFKNDQFYFQDSKGEIVLFDRAKQTLKNLGVFADFTSKVPLFPFVSKEEINKKKLHFNKNKNKNKKKLHK